MDQLLSTCKKLQISKSLVAKVKDSFEHPHAFFHNFDLCVRTANGVQDLRETLFLPRSQDRIYVLAAMLAYAGHSQGKLSYADEVARSVRYAQELLQSFKESEAVIQEVIRIIQLADAPQNAKLSIADQLLVAAGSLDFQYADWAHRFIEWEKESALKHHREAEEHRAIQRAIAKLDGRMPFWPDIVKARYLVWRSQFQATKTTQSATIGF